MLNVIPPRRYAALPLFQGESCAIPPLSQGRCQVSQSPTLRHCKIPYFATLPIFCYNIHVTKQEKKNDRLRKSVRNCDDRVDGSPLLFGDATHGISGSMNVRAKFTR